MNYVITVKKKNNNEQHFDVKLEYRTEVGSRIEWNDNKYLVKEIIITNPNEGLIELKCWNITNTGKRPNLIVRVS